MWQRHAFAGVSMVLGISGVLALTVVMNRFTEPPKEVAGEKRFIAFTPQKKPKKIKKKKKKAKPRRRRRAQQKSLAPSLLSQIRGPSFGIDSLADAATEDLTKELGDVGGNMVMTAESVDTLPKPLGAIAPVFPKQARARGVTGHVLLSLLIDAAGRVTKVEVVEAEPEGVFEDSAVDAYRASRFRPATYKGKATAMQVEAMVRFDQS